MKKRVLSMLMALIMVFSLMPVSVFAADTYAIGTVVESESVPNGAIPENSEWISSTTSTTGDLICTVEEEGHSHTAEAGCYATIVKTLWTLTAKAPEVKQEAPKAECKGEAGVECGAETHIAGCDKYEAPKAECKGEAGVECGAETHIAGCDKYEAPKAECKGEAGVECGAETHIAGCDKYEAPAPEVKQCAADCVLVEGHEGECKPCIGEECLFYGDPEHKGEPCFVEAPCTLTEGCALIAGHPGECTGVDDYDTAQTIEFTLYRESASNNRLIGSTEIMISKLNTETNTYETVGYITTGNYYSGSYGKASMELEPGDYIAYASFTYNNRYYALYETTTATANTLGFKFTVPVEDTTINLIAVQMDSASSNQMRAQSVYDSTTYFNHVDIRVNGTYTGGTSDDYTTYNIYLQNVRIKVTNPTAYSEHDFVDDFSSDNSETYEWRADAWGTRIYKGATVTMTADIYDKATKTLLKKDFTITWTDDPNGDNSDFLQAIINCDGFQGLDFRIDPVEIIQAIYHDVTYEWTMEDGTPFTLRDEPVDNSKYKPGAAHTVNSYWSEGSWVKGDTVIDDATHKIYTFKGWTEYSDEDTAKTTITGQTLTIDSDTTIYGVWTVADLAVATTHITIRKAFVDSNNNILTADEVPFNYRVKVTGPRGGTGYIVIGDTGFVRGNDGVYTYNLPVYTNGAYTFTEENYGILGSSVVIDTDVEEKGPNHNHITAGEGEGNTASVNVTLNLEYENETVCENIGTITFVNTYTETWGDEEHHYPDLQIFKHDEDHIHLTGAEFSLVGNGETKTATSGQSGFVYFNDLTPGTYVLTETNAPDGYAIVHKNFGVTVVEDTTPTVELRLAADGSNYYWVNVYNHTLSVTLDGEETTHFNGVNRLDVPNTKVTGKLTINKDISGDLGEADFPNGIGFEIKDASGNLVADASGNTFFVLNDANEWTVTLDNLPMGTYTGQEYAVDALGKKDATQSLDRPGYTWTTSVAGATNDSITFEAADDTDAVVEKTVIFNNHYTKKIGTAEHVYPTLKITKLRDSNLEAIDGAKFALYTDANCTSVHAADLITDNGAIEYKFTKDGTFYLKETQPADGYAANDTVWKVVVEEYSQNEELVGEQFITTHMYDVTVTVESGDDRLNFAAATDTLTVYNTKDEGSLTLKKVFPASNELAIDKVVLEVSRVDGTAFSVKVDGEVNARASATSHKIELIGEGAVSGTTATWTKKLTNLPLGEYKVVETLAYVGETDYSAPTDGSTDIDGKHWIVTYTPTKTGVNNAAVVEITSTVDEVSAEVGNTISTAYPMDLLIKKIDANSTENNTTLLPNAEFKVYRVRDGQLMVTAKTDSNGELMLPGFGTVPENANYEIYILEETQAPTYYEIGNGMPNLWKLVVTRNGTDTTLSVQAYVAGTEYVPGNNAPADTALTGDVSTGTANANYPNAVLTLTVQNNKAVGELSVTKVAEYNLDGEAINDGLVDAHKRANATYNITIALSDTARAAITGEFEYAINGKKQTDKLNVGTTGGQLPAMKAGDTVTIYGIPYGTYYTVTEDVEGKAFVSEINGDHQFVDTAAESVTVKNTYNYVTVNATVQAEKVDAAENTTTLSGAVFTLYKADKKTIVASDTSDAEGLVDLTITEEGTYYLKETMAPAGYHLNETEYEITAKWDYVTVKKGEHTVIEKRLVVTSDLVDEDQDGRAELPNAKIKPVVIEVEKKWEDGGFWNRPDSIIAILYRDGAVYDEQILSAANNWKHTWSGTDMTDAYTWTVGEVAVEGYKLIKVLDRDADGNVKSYEEISEVNPTETTGQNQETRTYNAELVNYREVQTIEITVEKAWDYNYSDGNKSEDRNLPKSVQVQLYTLNKDNERTAVGEPVTLNESNQWKHTWTGLKDTIKYTVDEITVLDDYTKQVTIDGLEFIITNTRIVKNVKINVEKIWDIPDDYEEKLPVGLEIHLYRNEETTPADTHILTADDDWKYTWLHLDDGSHLTDEDNWTFKEIVPEGYIHEHEKDFKVTRVEVTDTTKVYSVEITNHLKYEEKDLTVTKEWEVPDDYTDIPESVEVQLYRDGEEYGDPVKLSKDNQWTYKWEKLPDCFDWTVEELNVPANYDSEVISEDGWDITLVNTLDYDLVNVSVSKVWLNPKGYDKQPTNVAVVLYRDGEAYDTVVLSESNGWHYKWSGLEDCFEWTVDEPNVPKEYSKKITHIGNAWVITNAHKDIPLTGDDSPVWLWAGAAGVAVVGLGTSLFLLLKKRKKEEDEQA